MFRVMQLAVLGMIAVTALPICLGYVANVATPYRPIATGLRWDESDFPVLVDLTDAGPIGRIPAQDVGEAARNAMNAWNRALAKQLFAEGSGPNKVVTEGMGLDVGYVAQAQLRDHDGRLTHFTIVVNTSVSFSTAPEGDPAAYDLETVLVHELGHALGLDHPVSDVARLVGTVVVGDENAACYIYPGNTRILCPQGLGKVMRTPGPDDVAGVRAIYGW